MEEFMSSVNQFEYLIVQLYTLLIRKFPESLKITYTFPGQIFFQGVFPGFP